MSDNNKPPTPLQDYRCLNCGRLQFRAFLVEGCKIHIRCPRCGRGMMIANGLINMQQAVMVAAVAS